MTKQDNYFNIAQCPDDKRWYLFVGYWSDETTDLVPSGAPSYETEVEAYREGIELDSRFGIDTVDWPGWKEQQSV